MHPRQIERARRSQHHAHSTNDWQLHRDVHDAKEMPRPRRAERGFIRHRLSWFTTLQGLLFMCFMLIDRREHVMLTSLLVCAGVALCIPAIASTYTRAAIQNWLRLLLAVCWAAMGTLQFVWHAI